MNDNPLRQKLLPDEYVVKSGKPDKRAFLLKSVFNFLLPIAVLWCCIDIPLLVSSLTDGDDASRFFIIPFMLLHLMPVWLYLGNVLLSLRNYRNSFWLITDRTIYVSSGAFSMSVQTKPLAGVLDVSVERGLLEKTLHVGTIVFEPSSGNQFNRNSGFMIPMIKEYDEVEKLIRKMRSENVSDLMYPNSMRRPDDE